MEIRTQYELFPQPGWCADGLTLMRYRFHCSGDGFVNENLLRLGAEFTETFVMLTAIQAEQFLVDINSERNNHVGYLEQQ